MRRPPPATLLALAMVFPTLGAWIYFDLLAGRGGVPAAFAASKATQFALPLLAVWRAGVGWPSLRRPSPGQTALGILSGLAAGGLILAAAIGLLATPNAERVLANAAGKAADFGLGSPFAYLAFAATLTLVHSFLEEYYWRWFVFSGLERHLGFRPALLVASAAFAAHHVIVVGRYVPPGSFWRLTLPLSGGIALAGAFWCWLFSRSRSLLPPWISHALVDAALMGTGFALLWG